jgi:hypothetical protein
MHKAQTLDSLFLVNTFLIFIYESKYCSVFEQDFVVSESNSKGCRRSCLGDDESQPRENDSSNVESVITHALFVCFDKAQTALLTKVENALISLLFCFGACTTWF